jgi:TRAP-type C4-dicarboxylate transport system permease small subunit
MLAIRLLRLVDRALRAVELAAVSAALLLMLGLAFLEVVLQNAHIEALPPALWMGPVERHLVLWVGMLGASLAAGERRHISIEAIAKAVTPQGRRVVEGLVDLATVFVCAILTYVAWRYIDFIERPSPHEIVTVFGVTIVHWWSLMAIPIGFGLIGFRYARLLVERIFVDQPVEIEHALEIDEYDRKHASGEGPGAGALEAKP